MKVEGSRLQVRVPAWVRDSWRLGLLALSWVALVLCGCSTSRPVSDRPFLFKQDTFAYANGLVWEYHFDPATGKATHHRRKPPPDYKQHCFAVARSAKQFFLHAKFDASQPVAEDVVYRCLIREVISRSARSASNYKVIVPGFANLYAFSQVHEELLKEECGGAWQSYFQRGHWRMIFPFSRAHQERLASQLVESLKENCPPVIHVVRFPSLSINHAVVVFEAAESETEIRFGVYDPNVPEHPASLTFDRATRTFHFPANRYFIGGRVDVYEIYCAANY